MLKKMLLASLSILIVSSCTVVRDIKDNIDHYGRLSRDHRVQKINFDKNTDVAENMRFLVANDPDQTLILNGEGFNDRYAKLIGYLKSNGYEVLVNDKLPSTATIIAKVNKFVPDIRYVGVAMEQNSILKQTKYNIVYGGNKSLADNFYDNYKKLL